MEDVVEVAQGAMSLDADVAVMAKALRRAWPADQAVPSLVRTRRHAGSGLTDAFLFILELGSFSGELDGLAVVRSGQVVDLSGRSSEGRVRRASPRPVGRVANC